MRVYDRFSVEIDQLNFTGFSFIGASLAVNDVPNFQVLPA